MSSINPHERTTPPPSPELPPSGQSYRTQTPPRGKSSSREKRKPSVTPRKFRRFFTPRSLKPPGASSSRHALHETNGVGNRRSVHQPSPVHHPRPLFNQENIRTPFTRDSKRRKLYHTPESSPEHPRVANMQQETSQTSPRVMEDVKSSEEDQNIPSSPCERARQGRSGTPEEVPQKPIKPILQMEHRGLSAQLLQLRIDDAQTSRRKHLSYHINGMFFYCVLI